VATPVKALSKLKAFSGRLVGVKLLARATPPVNMEEVGESLVPPEEAEEEDDEDSDASVALRRSGL
jgi:hypothetical protein